MTKEFKPHFTYNYDPNRENRHCFKYHYAPNNTAELRIVGKNPYTQIEQLQKLIQQIFDKGSVWTSTDD